MLDLDTLPLTPEQKKAIEKAKKKFYSDDKSEEKKNLAKKAALKKAEAIATFDSKQGHPIPISPWPDSTGVPHTPFGRGSIR